MSEIVSQLNIATTDGRTDKVTGDRLYGIKKVKASNWLRAAGAMNADQAKSFVSFLEWTKEIGTTDFYEVETVMGAIDWWNQRLREI